MARNACTSYSSPLSAPVGRLPSLSGQGAQGAGRKPASRCAHTAEGVKGIRRISRVVVLKSTNMYSTTMFEEFLLSKISSSTQIRENFPVESESLGYRRPL